jgi:hypothetical protein
LATADGYEAGFRSREGEIMGLTADRNRYKEQLRVAKQAIVDRDHIHVEDGRIVSNQQSDNILRCIHGVPLSHPCVKCLKESKAYSSGMSGKEATKLYRGTK